MGYHPYWAGSAFTGYQWKLLSTIVFFSYEVDAATGSYANPSVINTWRTTSLVPTAKANGTEVQLCATLFGGTNLTNFLTNPTARLRCIDSLIALVALRNADGINIDFEHLPSSQSTNFTNFMQQLRDTLDRRRPGAKLSVALPAVDWSNAFDEVALSNICDQLFIMGYDFYWSTAPQAGPTGLLYTGSLWGSRCNSRSIIDYLANGSTRHKLILGVPYYGFRYPTVNNAIPSNTTGSGLSRTYANAKVEANTHGWNWDDHSFSRYFIYQSGGQWYQTWWHDSLSLAWMYRTALMQGIGGVGMWALSYDGSHPELWHALRDHFTDCAEVACQDSFFDMNGPRGSYFNRENWTWTLAPTGASQVSVTFHSFQLENGFDTLWIHNGPSTTSPLIGHYTGTTSPGTVTGTNGTLTFRFKSDNATVHAGWRATWSCVFDNTPPSTSIQPLRPWYNADFTAHFTDTDNQAVASRYALVADYDGSRWHANGAQGYAYEDFPGSALPPGWTAGTGTWTVSSGFLTQSDETQANTNLYFPLSQDHTTAWLYHWKMRLGGTGTNRRAGLHIFVSNPTLSQRGDSYLLWFRLDNQRIEIYEILGNTLPSPNYQTPYAFTANTWYDIKALYEPATGRIRIWINDQLAASYTVANILTAGSHVSFRTGNARVDYDEVRVYRSRGTALSVSVGSVGAIRYQSPSSTQPSGRLLSLVLDGAHLWSNVASASVRVDWTAPTTNLTVSGWKTTDFTQAFTDNDALSGIQRRFLLATHRSSPWQANTALGYLSDDFDAVQAGWATYAGTWSTHTTSGHLTQMDATSTNTGYHRLISQSTLALYRVRARLTNPTGNRRWGFHILADDPSQSQRGNSYLIWLRYDSQDLQIYETISNTLHLRLTAPISLSANTDYLVEALYDNGYIAVWLNGSLVAEWIDTTPLTSGSHVSLRSNQASIEVDFVQVWRGRSASEVISVGSLGALAAQNANPATPAGRLWSLVQDSAGNWSLSVFSDVNVDWTPPASPAEVRDGLGPDESTTGDGTQLSANWDASADANSGLLRYEYAIGTAPGSTDVVGWTLGTLALSQTHTGLSLTPGQTYYFGVRSVNGAGLTGLPTWSNGILYSHPLSYDGTAPTRPMAHSELRLFPNPTQGPIFVVASDSILPLRWRLLDRAGRIWKEGEIQDFPAVMDFSGLAAGLYYWIGPNGQAVLIMISRP
jgi:spore germination protein YaaH